MVAARRETIVANANPRACGAISTSMSLCLLLAVAAQSVSSAGLVRFKTVLYSCLEREIRRFFASRAFRE